MRANSEINKIARVAASYSSGTPCIKFQTGITMHTNEIL